METAAHIRLVLWKAARAVDGIDKASIADTGLQVTEFAIMEALLHKGPMPINTIGEKVLLTSGSMTAAINRLVKKRLVKREKDPADGRIYHVHLTPSGRQIITRAFEKHACNLERVASALTVEEREVLVNLLKKLGNRAQCVQLSDEPVLPGGAS